jgi:hypothetical protein
MFSKSVSWDECKAGFGDFYTQIVNADKPSTRHSRMRSLGRSPE